MEASYFLEGFRRRDSAVTLDLGLFASRAVDPLAESAEVVKRMTEHGLNLREVIPKDWMDELDERIGRLRAAVQIKDPKMPVPDWLSGTPGS